MFLLSSMFSLSAWGANELGSTLDCISKAQAALGDSTANNTTHALGPVLGQKYGVPGAWVYGRDGSYFFQLPGYTRNLLSERKHREKQAELLRLKLGGFDKNLTAPVAMSVYAELLKEQRVVLDELGKLRQQIHQGWFVYLRTVELTGFYRITETFDGSGVLTMQTFVGGATADFSMRADEGDRLIGTSMDGFEGLRDRAVSLLGALAARARAGKVHQGLIYQVMVACNKVGQDDITAAVTKVHDAEYYREGHKMGLTTAQSMNSGKTSAY